MNLIRIEWQNVTQSHRLGDTIELPDTPELRKALSVIMEATNIRIKRIHDNLLEDYLYKIVEDIYNNNYKPKDLRNILESVYNHKIEV